MAQHEVANTESIWNGSAWTEVNDLNTARKALGGANAGTYHCSTCLSVEQSSDPTFVAVAQNLGMDPLGLKFHDLNTASGSGLGRVQELHTSALGLCRK
jgi:hypothetical protein